MAIVFTGTRTRSGGVYSAWKKQLDCLSLKPAQRITFKFDPFGTNPKEVRELMFLLSLKKSIKTNPLCRLKYEVSSDRSEPTVDIKLENGDNVLFKCNNLTTLDMLKLYNKHITVLVPKEVPDPSTIKKGPRKGILKY